MEDTTRRDADEGGAAAGLFNRVSELARLAICEFHLPVDWADDLAQKTIVTLLRDGAAMACDEAVARIVRRLADRERQRRRREVERRSEVSERVEPSLPALCPRLAWLADHTPDRQVFLCTLASAAHAVAAEPGVLTDRQLRLFQLAYVDALGLEGLTRKLGAPTLVAARKRLYRISRRIERELLVCLTPLLTEGSRARILYVVGSQSVEPGFAREKTENSVSDALTELCDEVLLALQAVIHRNPGSAVS